MVNSTKKDPSVRNTVSLNAYWQTFYVYARSIRYAIDFDSGRKKGIASFDELIIFLKKHRSFIARAAGNLINFQAVVKKRLSEFELLKCCRIFQQRSQTDFVSNQRAVQVLQKITSAAELTVLFRERKTDANFSYDTSQTFGTHRVYKQSAVVVKWSSIQSNITLNSDTSHKQTIQGSVAYYIGTSCQK